MTDGSRNFWKSEEELLLKEWADKAQCNYWLHLKSHRKYKIRSIAFTLPVIIISTLTGTASFAQDKFGPYVELGNILIGTMNIIAAIISTVYQFLKIAELTENHKIATVSWEKFHELIRIELIKNPIDRTEPVKFLEICSNQYTHLIEFCPIVSEDIIKEFKSKFKKAKNITFPEVCGRLQTTQIFGKFEISPITNYSDESASEVSVVKLKPIPRPYNSVREHTPEPETPNSNGLYSRKTGESITFNESLV